MILLVQYDGTRWSNNCWKPGYNNIRWSLFLVLSSGALTLTSAAATLVRCCKIFGIDCAAGTLTLDGHTGVTNQASNSGNVVLTAHK